MRRRIFVAALLLASGCTIIINGDPPPPPPPGVGVPALCSAELAAQPDVDVIFDMRIERSVVALEGAYAEWMKKTFLGLLAAGINPSRAVLFRLDERPVPKEPLAAWGCDLGGFDLDPSGVIEHYATKVPPDGKAVGCAVDPLLAASADLGGLVTSYPPEIPGESGRRVFGPAPDAVLVVHLDSLARRAGYDDAACRTADALATQAPDGSAPWLHYSSGSVPADRVFHWFITTDEDVSRETFVERCRRVEGFPTGVLDLLEPSVARLYDPLGDAIASGSGGRVARISLCEMLSAKAERRFLESNLGGIAATLGVNVNPELLDKVLSGDGNVDPSELPAGTIPVGPGG